MARELISLVQVDSSSKEKFIPFSYIVPLQLILKYAYTLDVLIHYIVHMECFDDTLPILENFEKIQNLNEVQPSFLTIFF